MNRQDRGILVGMVLGDGYLRSDGHRIIKGKRKAVSAQLAMYHSAQQAEYLEYKSELLRKIFGGKHRVTYREQVQTSGYKCKMCLLSKGNPYFKTLRKILYPCGIKTFSKQALNMLTPHGISIWFMDDGSTRCSRRMDGSITSVELRLCTYCSLEENENIRDYFSVVHGVDCGIRFCKKTNKYYIIFNTKQSHEFVKIIEPYVIPSMQYKIQHVHSKERHERLAPDKECCVCYEMFGALKSRGMCSGCFDRLRRNIRFGDNRIICPSCRKDQFERWFVGGICRSCYVRNGTSSISGDDISRAHEN